MVWRRYSLGSEHSDFKNLDRKMSGGFTLIELLIVMGILTILMTITLIKFRPLQRMLQVYGVQSKSDIRQIQNALLQAMIDGHLPKNIPERKDLSKIICQYNYQGFECIDPPIEGVDLSYLVPDYIATIPYDPVHGSGAKTGYKIYKDGAFFIIESIQ